MVAVADDPGTGVVGGAQVAVVAVSEHKVGRGAGHRGQDAGVLAVGLAGAVVGRVVKVEARAVEKAESARRGLVLGTTPAGKFMLSIFASLAEYDRESILEKTKAGQQLAAAQGKHIGRPKGLDAENLSKVRKALEKGLSVAETAELTGISLSSVKRYRKHLQAALS